MTAFARKTQAELCKADDIVVTRAQIRRLTARVENEIIPEIARRHDVAILDERIISVRYTDVELIDTLRAALALKITAPDAD